MFIKRALAHGKVRFSIDCPTGQSNDAGRKCGENVRQEKQKPPGGAFAEPTLRIQPRLMQAQLYDPRCKNEIA